MLAVLFSLGLASPAADAADKITFVTDFGYNGRHAYYFVALEKGYYARQNLEVDIVRGQGSADAVKQVAAGTAQLGFADTAAVILGRGNDQIPTKLVAIVYAKPPHAIFVLKDSGISKPKDLEGKKIADTAFSAVPKLFDAYAKAAKIDGGKVTWLVATSDALPGMLKTGRADGIGQFTVGAPLLAKTGGAAGDPRAGVCRRRSRSLWQRHHRVGRPAQIKSGSHQAVSSLRRCKASQTRSQIRNRRARSCTSIIVRSMPTSPPGRPGSSALSRSRTACPLGALDPERVKKSIDIVSGAFTLKNPVTPARHLRAGIRGPVTAASECQAHSDGFDQHHPCTASPRRLHRACHRGRLLGEQGVPRRASM